MNLAWETLTRLNVQSMIAQTLLQRNKPPGPSGRKTIPTRYNVKRKLENNAELYLN